MVDISLATLSNPTSSDQLDSGTAALKHATQHSNANDQIERMQSYMWSGGTPSCRVYNNANISITNNTVTTLTFNSERWDTDTMHSTSSNTGRITFTTAGVYLVTASISFAANATGSRWVVISINGTTTYPGGEFQISPGSGAKADFAVSTLYAFTAGQYAEVVVYQNSGGSLNVETTSTSILSPEFMAVRVGGQ